MAEKSLRLEMTFPAAVPSYKEKKKEKKKILEIIENVMVQVC